MKDRIRVNRTAAVLMVVQILVLLFFAGQKKGYFIDEIYSWGLSNSYYKPFVASYDVFDRWIEGDVFEDYMTVGEGERFAYGSVYYNQTQDVHPPLYYMLFHTLCSLTPGVFNKWQGILLNVFFYGGCLAMIFLTARRLTKSEGAALAAMAVWGFSPGGLSTGIYIRMYMMMAFFSIATVYLHVRMAEEGQGRRILAAVCAVTFLGLLTQYYFVFLAFFLSAVYVLWKLQKQKWKEASVYAAALFASVGLMVLVYPALITQLARTDEFVASETRNNLLNGSVMVRNLISYVSDINMDFFSGRIREAAAVMALFLGFGLWRNRKKGGGRKVKVSLDANDRIALALALVWVLSFLAVSGAAVVTGVRYIYNLYPLFCVLLVWAGRGITGWALKGTKACGMVRAGILAAGGILFLTGFRLGYVRYLYPENEERVRLARQYEDLYCLYINNYENAPLTQDLMELSGFRGVYVMPKEEIERVQELAEGKDWKKGLVVYVDTNDFWSSGYDGTEVMEKLKAETKAREYVYLYAHELSETYLLKWE